MHPRSDGYRRSKSNSWNSSVGVDSVDHDVALGHRLLEGVACPSRSGVRGPCDDRRRSRHRRLRAGRAHGLGAGRPTRTVGHRARPAARRLPAAPRHRDGRRDPTPLRHRRDARRSACSTPMPGAEFCDRDGNRVVGYDIPEDHRTANGHHPVIFDQPSLEHLLRTGPRPSGSTCGSKSRSTVSSTTLRTRRAGGGPLGARRRRRRAGCAGLMPLEDQGSTRTGWWSTPPCWMTSPCPATAVLRPGPGRRLRPRARHPTPLGVAPR